MPTTRRASILLALVLALSLALLSSACGSKNEDEREDQSLSDGGHGRFPQGPSTPSRPSCPHDAARAETEKFARARIAQLFPAATALTHSRIEEHGNIRVTHGAPSELPQELEPVFRIFRFNDPSSSSPLELLALSGFRAEDCRRQATQDFVLSPLQEMAPALSLSHCDPQALRAEVIAEVEEGARMVGKILKIEVKTHAHRSTILPRLFSAQDTGDYAEVFVSFQTEISPTRPGQDVSRYRSAFNMTAVLVSRSDCTARGSTQYL
jgi:hypothetical protein